MSFQVLSEIIKTLLIFILLSYVILNRAKLNSGKSGNSLLFIEGGLFLIFLGSLLELGDNYKNLNFLFIFGESFHNLIIRNLIGYVLGIVLIVLGLSKWIPKVHEDNVKKNELEVDVVKNYELHQQLNTILRSIGDAVIAVDSDKNIIHMNPVAERITCWNESEALGRPLKKVYKTDKEIALDNDNIIDSLLSDYALENEIQTINVEDKKGNKHLISSRVTPMMENEKLSGMVIIFREMESVETIQKRLTQKKKMESLSIFANGVAHDFNNQLTGVQGFCELLESEVKDDEQLDYISEIRKAVDRSVELTDKLLAFARKEEPKDDEFNVVQDITSLVENYGDVSKKIKVTGPKNDLYIKGNKPRILTTFKNIIDNAFEAIDENGKVEISIFREFLDEEFLKYYPYAIPTGEYARFTIKDNGIGMNGETLEKVYEPFFTTGKRSYGKGMGLSFVYGTISRHEGLVTINSKLEKGTEVNVYLPISLDIIESGLRNSGKIKNSVMVVDDEEFIRFYIKKELERRGFVVKVFEDGESALKYYERHLDEFNIAVIDCVMPKISGMNLVDLLRAKNENLKIILMSGKVLDKEFEERIKKCENCKFLSKPFDGPTLMNAIEVKLND